ncbi:MAG TPA: UDP-N-acetylmuramoyl-tripeptide--D-alanyl-D-alanine ligase [Dehalococcoidia bacterium]|nr:UDP-N-acetylmuramoyl-tripeptide--D-alanyl-D-alanine ligase [Dehalococcoidia bacterium]
MAGKMITAKELAAGLSDVLAQAPHQAPARFRHAVVDSRKAGRGDLFFALAGEHADGHDFVRDAAARGASGAVVARAVDAAIAQWVVRDPLEALQALARQRRASLTELRVVGVTGSVGKTSTKEVIAAVLATKHRVLKSEGNLNSEIGMPLVLLELNARHRRAVLEMGMWARGEIALLCHLARPQVGVVTMVGPVHMERLGTIDAIAEEKGVLPASLPADGVAVLNADDARVLAMRERTRAGVITFGLAAQADVRAEDIETRALSGSKFTLVHGGGRETVYSRLPGRAMVHNALAAAAVALTDGFTLAETAEALSAVQVPARLTSHRGANGSTVIDDAYNASPASMLAALDLLGEVAGRKFAVLGDMRELGAAEAEGHRDVGRRAAEVADVIYAVGELGRMIGEAARDAGHGDVRIVADKAQIAPALRTELAPGDVVLVKASRALALETVAQDLREG